MNKNRATHDGTCQICGSFQKLPGGVLSKHGYTTRWGFFEGVCTGAHGKPFEQSTDLIEAAIARATEYMNDTRKESEELKAGKLIADSTKAWKHVYRAPRGRNHGGYFWELVAVTMETKTYHEGTPEEWTAYNFRYQEENPDDTRRGGREIHNGYGDDKCTTVDEMRVKMNAGYAKSELDARVKQLADYIAWQKERIANWEPKPLEARAE